MGYTDADYWPDFVVGGYSSSPRSCCKLSDVRGGGAAGLTLGRLLRLGVAAAAAAGGVAAAAAVFAVVAVVALLTISVVAVVM